MICFKVQLKQKSQKAHSADLTSDAYILRAN